MVRRIAILVAVSALTALGAGSHPARGQAPPAQTADVKSIVRAVEARYSATRTLRATFLERYAESQKDVRVESGTVYFGRPGRMRWEYEVPESKLFLSDGKTVWFYVPADRTVTRAKLKESSDWRTPLALLTGKAKFSRFCGRIDLADVRVQAAGNVVLRCLPKNGDAGFREVLIEVDAAYRLMRILIREAAAVETDFLFARWEENIAIPEVLFHFQAPPGVAIVDEATIAGSVR
jgi:outer membrane lipoprotein carrier protein